MLSFVSILGCMHTPQVMGVIPEDAICTQYWPGKQRLLLFFMSCNCLPESIIIPIYRFVSFFCFCVPSLESFSQRLDSQLRLTSDCSLGQEMMIDFCLHNLEEEEQQQQRKKARKKKKPKPKQSPGDLPQMISTLMGARAAREKDAQKNAEKATSASRPALPGATPDTASPTAVGTPREGEEDRDKTERGTNNSKKDIQQIAKKFFEKSDDADDAERLKEQLDSVAKRLSEEPQQIQKQLQQQHMQTDAKQQQEQREQQQQGQQQQQQEQQQKGKEENKEEGGKPPEQEESKSVGPS